MRFLEKSLPILFLGIAISTGRCLGGPFLEGVDVSQYNGLPDWDQVAAAGRVFAFARVNDGTNHLDSSFAADYAGIKAAGMIRGAYQFFEPNEDPVAQAHTLLAAIGPLGPGDLPPALVVEVSDGESPAAIANAIRSWVNTVEGATGEIPIIYSSSSFWDGFVGSTNFFNDPLWDAAWDVALPTHLPTGWPAGDWQFWQYLDSGDVSGIGGAVDLDRFNGTIGQLDSLAHVGDARVHDDSSVAALLFGAMAGIVVLRLAYGRSPLMPLG